MYVRKSKHKVMMYSSSVDAFYLIGGDKYGNLMIVFLRSLESIG